MSDVTFDMEHNRMEVHEKNAEPWRVTLIDTGHDTLTGGRLLRVKDYIGDETFCFTYGDGLADVNIDTLIQFHRSQGKAATLTAIQPPGRYGALNIAGDAVLDFQEKPAGDGAWVNGGFFVLEPSVLDYIDGDLISWEAQPLQRLATENQLAAYQHKGFWQAMDTMRDKNHLEELWNLNPPWKVW
jgi:glucose-1-phosphate cytidylyltransferase